MHQYGVFRRLLGGCEKADGEQEMIQDDMIVRLGQAQQKVMSLTVAKRRLEARLEKVEERAEVLEELVMDVVADLQENVLRAVILERIGRIMQRLDADD
jgi:ferredoxin-fold anticodon binding domain-containing protein